MGPFDYKAPTPEQVARITELRNAIKNVAVLVEGMPMDHRCKALTNTKLEEASMWGNKGIVFEPPTSAPDHFPLD